MASFILRLTIRNGFTSPLDWLDKATWNAVTKNATILKRKRLLTEFIPTSLQIQKPNLSARHSALFPDCHADTPRICPICVRGSGYLKENWRYIGNLLCEIHSVALVDCCQQCEEQLEWSPLLLQCTCTNVQCACQLKSPKVSNELTELFIDEICDCLLASLFLTKPFTTVLPSYKRPVLKNFNKSIEDGFRLLTEKERFNNLQEKLASTDSPLKNLPQKYQLFPITLLRQNLKSTWPMNRWFSNLSDHYQSTSHKINNIEEFTVTVDSAVKLLSITKAQIISTIPKLSHKKVLPGNTCINIAPLITKD